MFVLTSHTAKLVLSQLLVLSFVVVTGICSAFSQVCTLVHTGCLTTDMNKVSAFFMEIAPYFIENFDHILFTIEVSFVIMPYLGEKLKGNSGKFSLKKI